MPIKFPDTLEPQAEGVGLFPVVADVHVQGGLRVVSNDAEMLATTLANQKVGMLVYNASRQEYLQLTALGSPATFTPLSSGLVPALVGAKSHVLAGGELYNTYATDTNDDVTYYFAPAATVQPGVIRMPNGDLAKFAAPITRTMYTSGGLQALELKRQNIAGSNTWDADDQMVYWFVRYKAGVADPALRFDHEPPDDYGRPRVVGGSELAAGYSVNDYAYVGALSVKLGGTSLSAGYTDTDAFYAVWGHCRVSYAGTGVRRVTLANHDDLSSQYTFTYTLGTLSSAGRTRRVVIPIYFFRDGDYDFGGGAIPVIAKLRTAKTVSASFRGSVKNNVGASAFYIQLSTHDAYIEFGSDTLDNIPYAMRAANIPIRSESVSLDIQFFLTTGSPELLLADQVGGCSLHAFVENVNDTGAVY